MTTTQKRVRELADAIIARSVRLARCYDRLEAYACQRNNERAARTAFALAKGEGA